MATDSHEEMGTVDRYWDEIVRGRRITSQSELPDKPAQAIIAHLAERPSQREIDEAFANVWRRLNAPAVQREPAPTIRFLRPVTPEDQHDGTDRPRPVGRLVNRIAEAAMIAAVLALVAVSTGVVSDGGAWLRAIIAPAQPQPIWPLARGNAANTGADSGADLRTMPAVAWTASAGGQVAGPPIIGNGLLYVATTDVIAMDLTTGAERWRISTGGTVVPLALDGDTLYAASAAGRLLAFDADSGHERWQTPFQPATGAGVIATDGSVYAFAASGDLVALDQHDGHERWRSRLSTATNVTAALAAANGVIAAAVSDKSVRVLDAHTGAARWKTTLSTPYDEFIDAPVLAGERIYVTSKSALGVDPQGKLDVFELATGSRLWSFALPAKGVLTPAALSGDTLVLGGGDKKLYALDSTTGTERWAVDLGAPMTQAPAISDGTVYVLGTDRVLRAVALSDGTLRWELRITGGNLPGGVVIAPDALLGATASGKIVSLREP